MFLHKTNLTLTKKKLLKSLEMIVKMELRRVQMYLKVELILVRIVTGRKYQITKKKFCQNLALE